MRIGFIGLGNMGGPMAANLVAAGYSVFGHDISDVACARAQAKGVHIMNTVTHAYSALDIIITMLPTERHVLSVLENEIFPSLERCDNKPVLIDCSTIDISTARKIASHAKDKGIDLLDAPVSGGVSGAESGTLAFMIGGDSRALEIAVPLFEVMGTNVIHVGASGAGQAAKMCNNMMLAIQMISVCEGFTLAEQLGLDWQKLFDVSANASAQCWSLTTYCPVPGPVPDSRSTQNYTPGFSAALMHKDLGLAMKAAKDTHVKTPLGNVAMQMYTDMVESGKGEMDFSAILEAVRGSLPTKGLNE